MVRFIQKKGTVRKIALCPIPKRHMYLSKERQSGDETEEYRGRNTEQTQNEKVDNIESNPDVRGSASEECGGGFGQPCKALDHRSHL